jgi:hypothetical protein
MSGYAVNLVPTAEIRRYWKHARPHLQAAIDLSDGRWTPEYVLAALVLGEQGLWLVVSDGGQVVGAITTEGVQYPEKKALALHFMGGDGFDDWYLEMFNAMVKHAQDVGCDVIESNARFGFWKWFKPSGFTKPSVFYELKV